MITCSASGARANQVVAIWSPNHTVTSAWLPVGTLWYGALKFHQGTLQVFISFLQVLKAPFCTVQLQLIFLLIN